MITPVFISPVAAAIVDCETGNNCAICLPGHSSTPMDYYQMQYLWLAIYKTEVGMSPV